jgi:hypothetical protein
MADLEFGPDDVWEVDPAYVERDRYREALEAVRAQFDPDRYPAELADPVVQIVEAALRPQTDNKQEGQDG